ncbi:sugar ABC transporter ATP-binding protein [Nonomuraea rhizosphaerae]|uniref:sugar ABC transporter ATP-binding protein n=1 Tax=Nonomuraea rhizosphaerae TaxID=2665663 RepID=UPI001C5F8CFB|nr:sugar ABC transporter ATP-binding protein [Nonomuraea rhizosphaerae]
MGPSSDPPDPDKPPLLAVRGLVKHFTGARALDGVDFEVAAGEVHCLLGQNGAGKSTLIKVLAGAHEPDAGALLLDGRPVRVPSPHAALELGIVTIYQELDVVPGLRVYENVFLGHEHARAGWTRRRRMRAATADALRRLGHEEIRPDTELAHLSPASRQVVSLARALSRDARLIIMDEPSAALAGHEVDNLFRVIDDLRSAGLAVVYITHRLAEVRQIGDRVTVLKDGRTVASGLEARTTPDDELVRLMTGRKVGDAFPPRGVIPDDAPEVLRVEGLTRAGEFTDVSFSVRAGEIVGLAGLVGSGRSEILGAVYGATRPDAGEVTLDGRPLGLGDPAVAVRSGLGLAPEERKSQALLLDEAVYRNLSLASLRRYVSAGLIDRDREMADARAAIGSLDVRPAEPLREIRQLSGGNQQKVVVGRWLIRGCRVLLLDEPTRGVDVGARAELYALIRRLAGTGVGILLVSSEIPEVLGLADRVLVVRQGRVIADRAAESADEEQILSLLMKGSAL